MASFFAVVSRCAILLLHGQDQMPSTGVSSDCCFALGGRAATTKIVALREAFMMFMMFI
jgi:hypothetical protein